MSRSLRLLVLFCAVSLVAPAATFAAPATPTAAEGCTVTPPNGETPPGTDPDDNRWFGSGSPDATFWLLMDWGAGAYSSQPDRYQDQSSSDHVSGHALKFAFYRIEGSGDITLAVTDAEVGKPLADERRYLYPDIPQPIPGLTNLVVVVPDTGCWTITASDGNDALAWTLLVTTAIDGCDITQPNDQTPPDSTGDRWYGSDNPDASLWVTIPNPPIAPAPGFEPRDEGGYRVKTPFWRGEGSGPIELTGDRLDEPSPYQPRIDADWDAYEVPGFIATGVWYPTEGCWRLTATDGNDTITWTALVRSPFANCPVTSGTDDGGGMPDNAFPVDPDHYYGEDGLYVYLSPDTLVRRYPIDSGHVSGDGAISDKFGWYRQGDAAGELSITVENAGQWFPDEPEISIPSGYGSSGVQASSITFPGPGCWEVTGTSGDVSITFTVRLEIVPAGAA